MATNIGRLGIVLGLATEEFTSGLGKATVQLSQFVDKAKPAILGVAAAMTALIGKTVAWADSVDEIAAANEIAIGTIINLGSGLEAAGGSADNASKLIASFTSKIDSAAEGSKGAQRAFDRIGISLKDIAGKDNQTLLQETIEKLAAIEDPVTRNALAFQTFGRAAKGVDFIELNRQLKENAQITDEQAEAIKASAEVVDKLQKVMREVYITIVSELGPKLLDTIKHFDMLTEKGSLLGDVFGTVFETIVVLGANTYFVVERLTAGVTALLEASGKALKADFAGAKQVFADYNTESARLRENLDAFEKKILDRNKRAPIIAGGASSPTAGGVALRTVRDADAEAADKAKLITQQYIDQNNALREQLIRKGQLVYLDEQQRELANAIFAIEDERVKKIGELQKQIAEERIKPDAARNDKLIAELEVQIKTIDNLAESYKKLTIEQIQSQQRAQSTFEFGFQNSFRKFADDATNAAKLGAKVFETFASTAEKALDQFVRSGKIAFGDLVREMLIELVKVEIKAKAIAFFRAASGGGSILGGIGSLFGFADGGDPPTGKPYVVGERGPEIRVDRKPGTIIPMNAIANADSADTDAGSGIVVNGPYIQNFSAIDASSGAQFLMSQYQTIWSANQKAAQGKPTSGRYF